jgi:hypothetical protein
MMGTLAGKLGSTAGAIGCLLQLQKGPVASSSEQRKKGCMWRETAPFNMNSLGVFGNLHPRGKRDSQDKGGSGH